MRQKSTRRVLIVGNGSLFDEGLMSLLARETQLEVSSLTCTDEAEFLQHFDRERPEAIFLFEGSSLSVSRIFELIADLPDVPALRVITVLSEESKIEVYEKQHFTAVWSDDLVSLLRQHDSAP